MAIEIKKKEREPVSFMLRRFSRKVQQSRVLLQKAGTLEEGQLIPKDMIKIKK